MYLCQEKLGGTIMAPYVMNWISAMVFSANGLFSLYWSINWARTLEMALRIVDWIRVTVKGDGGIVLFAMLRRS
ncbi:hypothetical protein BDV32DRAFT_133691 [Aspergillus pseudonomiae]|nr:hypothetical protein BDV32DRAFT_133691 [Aspergillus pseudonomiae]